MGMAAFYRNGPLRASTSCVTMNGMETDTPRIGFIGILIEDRHAAAPEVNRILSDCGDIIRARLGMPWKDRGISVVTLVVEATSDQVGALTGRLGLVPGVSVKSGLSKG